MGIRRDLEVDLVAPGLRDVGVGGAHEPLFLLRAREEERGDARRALHAEGASDLRHLLVAVLREEGRLVIAEGDREDDVAARPVARAAELARDVAEVDQCPRYEPHAYSAPHPMTSSAAKPTRTQNERVRGVAKRIDVPMACVAPARHKSALTSATEPTRYERSAEPGSTTVS